MAAASQLVGVVSVLLLMVGGNAFEFRVGGSGSSWSVPSDPNAAIYNRWAEKSRFQIGDTLLFVYDGRHDSVLHVTKDDYDNCNTASPREKFSDGHTEFKLSESGAYYFISGAAENCRKNEKLVVVVMADRANHKSNDTPPPPEDHTPFEDNPPNDAAALSTHLSAAAAALSLLGFSLILAI